ncbi:MAG: DoxX family protein [Muribaculaceae bacterium]|nr:DoxX family protein [Muribaculaceae bacterium]
MTVINKSTNPSERLVIAITWIIRILVGATFAYSGFVKAIDPWGTFYKFEDYMAAMSFPVYENLLLVGVFGLCAYEFCLGIFLLTGCFRRSTPIAAIIMMAVMLPLTLWIAVADPVADCGCFGDALVISNWATFWKNVVLVGLIIWLLRYNAKCRCLIRPFVQWIALLGSVAYIVIIGFVGYIYQPLIDFRPFPIGRQLAEPLTNVEKDEDQMAEQGEAVKTDVESGVSEDAENIDSEIDNLRFVYAKDGIEKSFSIDDELPDESEGWIFVRREGGDNDSQNTDRSANNSDDSSFRIWSLNGEDDVTSDVIKRRGGELLLLMPDLKSVSMAMTWRINSLYLWARDNDIEMIGIVAATPAEIENWQDISLASYPIYTAEDTQIKMLARGNPAVVYLENGSVVWKSSLRSLDTEDFQASEALRKPSSYARDDHGILKNISGFYLLLIALLIFLSFLPMMGRFFPSKVRNQIEERDSRISEKEQEAEQRIKSRLKSRKV